MSESAGENKIVRAGFVALVGRPNTGKSTLMNALAGGKVSIVSRRRQTTRGIIRAAVRHKRAQIILLDSPGRQTRNPDDFSRRINAGADWAAAAADAAVFVCNPIWRREDEDFLSRLPSPLPVVAAVNKIDLVQNKRDLLPFADALQQRHNFAAIVPVSASRGIGVDILADELAMLLPKSPPLFSDSDSESDLDLNSETGEKPRLHSATGAVLDDFFWAEIIREKIFRALGDELPYRVGVVVRQSDEGKMLRIAAEVYAERNSQKATLIGEGGQRLKKIASAARREMEIIAGRKVFLTARVLTRPHWRRSPQILAQMRVGPPDG